MEEKKVYLDIPKFSGANVPISLVAKVMKKDAQFIRLGLQKCCASLWQETDLPRMPNRSDFRK